MTPLGNILFFFITNSGGMYKNFEQSNCIETKDNRNVEAERLITCKRWQDQFIYTGKFVELEGGFVFNSVLTLFDSFCDLNIFVKYMLRRCA
ncbi:hypothetical protein T07_8665 [Trichinella nelsoni]|uniref:Uncharacterized protein n=1 Tax=Trichinella nelsoni TaxID=6336 RepID=A0A0V0RSR8_9BILA|nr:hypothetical protein T07_8665 [Trichinella nelsoni]